MSFLGIGLHVLVAIFFAVHAYRTAQPMYWLFILLAFPLLGSLVYFLAVYLPNTRLDQGAKKIAKVATKVLDPTKELRDAKAAFDYSPTAQNQVRLAAALLKAGYPDEAATFYQNCLKGPFAADPEIRLGAAQALQKAQRHEEAIAFLQMLRADTPGYRAEQIALLLARALADVGDHEAAHQQFAEAVVQFGSAQARAEYAIWAAETGDWATAEPLHQEIIDEQPHWNRHTRKINAPLMQRLNSVFETKRKRA